MLWTKSLAASTDTRAAGRSSQGASMAATVFMMVRIYPRTCMAQHPLLWGSSMQAPWQMPGWMCMAAVRMVSHAHPDGAMS